MKHRSANPNQTNFLIKKKITDSRSWGVYNSHCSLKREIWKNQFMLKRNSLDLLTDYCMTRSTATIRHGRDGELVITKLAPEPCRTPGELLVFVYTGSLKKLLQRSVPEWTLTSTWTRQKEWRQARTKQIFSSSVVFKIILILIFW